MLSLLGVVVLGPLLLLFLWMLWDALRNHKRVE